METKDLSYQDAKNIARLMLGGKVSHETVWAQIVGKRTMQPYVSDAILAYTTSKIGAETTYNQLMEAAGERFRKYGLDASMISAENEAFTQERLEVNAAYEAGDLGTEEVIMNHKAQLVA